MFSSDCERRVTTRRLLYLIADDVPTHRADVSVLFGRELPRHGVVSDIVARLSSGAEVGSVNWTAGKLLLCRTSRSRWRSQISAFWHDVCCLGRASADRYQAIQVRDKVFAGLVALLVARRKRLPFFYWMSFPMSEGFIHLSRERGLSLGVGRWLYLMLKGYLGRYLMYHVILRAADHVFVQSRHMAAWIEMKGIPANRLTAVPMGVDLESLREVLDKPATRCHELDGRRLLVYQGTMDRARRIDLLFEVLREVKQKVPNTVLLLVGGATDVEDQRWLEVRAEEIGVSDALIWTGWISQKDAWDEMRKADVAVSLIPRGELFDYSSPTKVVEYLALGLPVVGNDLPDQHEVITESGAGLSVRGNVQELAAAIVSILMDSNAAMAMRIAGPRYIQTHRSYEMLGRKVAEVYGRILPVS